jgi:hypothetical protein
MTEDRFGGNVRCGVDFFELLEKRDGSRYSCYNTSAEAKQLHYSYINF